jgi:hypothetical protein
MPSTGARGLFVRPVLAGLNTFAASTVGQDSTSEVIVSSNAATKAFVYAYTITSTITGSIQGGFYAGTALKWPLCLASSGGVMVGANLAVTPPGYLFRNSTGESLTFRFPGSTHAGVCLGVAYWEST